MSWVRKQMLMLAAMAVVVSGGAARGDTIIDTSGNFSGTVNPFGIPETQTYGQTLTVPTNGDFVLTSFTFYMSAAATLDFRGEVYAWDGAEATGSSLYESAPVHTSGGAFYEPVTFLTGGIALTPGSLYVIFVSSSKDNAGHLGQGNFEIAGDAYTGGNFVYLNNSTDASQWTSTAWAQTFSPSDLVFTADFGGAGTAAAGVPLPSTSVAGLGLLSLTGIVLVGRRRRPAV